MTIIHNNKEGICPHMLMDLFSHPYSIKSPSLIEEMDPAMDSVCAWVQETSTAPFKLERKLISIGGHHGQSHHAR